jgi:hypothetical protein
VKFLKNSISKSHLKINTFHFVGLKIAKQQHTHNLVKGFLTMPQMHEGAPQFGRVMVW